MRKAIYLYISILLSIGASGQILVDTNFYKLVDAERSIHQHLFEQMGVSNMTNTASSNNFDVNYYRCEWKIDPSVRYIGGKVTSYFTITTPSVTSISYDLSDTLFVDSISYHSQLVSFQRPGNDALEIQFPVTLNIGAKDSISIYYKGVPRVAAGFGAFVQATHSGIPVIWTLSEPYGSKEWWPCKNGLTDKADSLDIILLTPLAYRGSSNGALLSEDSSATNRQVYFKHRYPIASYLVCLAVTNYAILKDSALTGGKQMPLISYVFPENFNTFKNQEIHTKKSMELFSKLFGDYPFAKEKYGHTQFGWGGGMEHQTNSFLVSPSAGLIAHELGHQWFGDKVTCASWEDIWLNEGFAFYLQALYGTVLDPNPVSFINGLRAGTNVITAAPDGSVKVNDTTNVNRIFNGRLSYYKGSYLVHMLRGILGDSLFFQGIREYLNDSQIKYGYARTIDLQRNLEKVSGKKLAEFFNDWYVGEGYPNYSATWALNKNNWIKVTLNQTTSHPSVPFYEMPIQLQFKNANKDTIFRIEHTSGGQVFWLNPGFIPDTLVIDPNYWILSKIRTSAKIILPNLKSDDIKIYPNPAPNDINIVIYNPTVSTLHIKLFNSVGQLVYRTSEKLNGRDEQIILKSQQLPKGAYYLILSNDKGLKRTFKVLK